ncbi:MAG: dihydrodipicolinate synthase family protein, partial [Bacteroidetes bacterium]|nr:dihydrodipicolinate synthase family protein [Bacteroidota bacterium]
MHTPWAGVFPAATTPFDAAGALDTAAMERHLDRLVRAGVHGIVVNGSLGEAGTLTRAEKLTAIRCARDVAAGRIPVLTGLAETTTAAARTFASEADAAGATGIMLLPPMQYISDRRETLTYLRSVAEASPLPIMIYNNPVAYRVDVIPEMFEDLADEPSFVALKESSDDPRRITDILNRVGNRYRIFVGVDDLALESLLLGADGWVAGLVSAFPDETVALYTLARQGRLDAARSLYRWFMPLLHLDTSTKFVHYIKLAQAMAGLGSEDLRPPRLPLSGQERIEVEAIIAAAIATRPDIASLLSVTR